MSDEVLVHISTPATRQNDELFRSLANAYLEFKPHRVQRDRTVRGTAGIDETIRSQPIISTSRGSADGGIPNPSAPTASKETYGSFPSDATSGELYLAQDEVLRPTSRLAQLDRSYLNWRKRATPKMNMACSEVELRISSDDLDADTGFLEDSQSALQALQSQLQDTYSTTSADTSEVDDNEDEDSAEPRGQSVPAISLVQSHESEIAEERPLAAPSDVDTQTAMDASKIDEPTDLPGHAIPVFNGGHQITADHVDFSELSVDAFSPPPAVSVARPEALPSQITKHLAAIKTKNPNRFKPRNVQRDLESDERGFWRVDCTRWRFNAQRDFWLLLCEHVLSGRLGWATTLHRESMAHEDLGSVRIYCWGQIVEHMWLILWLCSEGKIFGLGSEWIDANGIVVINMD